MTRVLSASLIALTLCGCSSSSPAPTTPERLLLRHLAILYGKYQGANQGKPPKDEAQFKKFIKGLNENQLATAGVSPAEIDELFVSPRDGQPYDIRYNNPPSSEALVVAERTGRNGKRMVAYSTGRVDEIDDAEYQKIRFTTQ